MPGELSVLMTDVQVKCHTDFGSFLRLKKCIFFQSTFFPTKFLLTRWRVECRQQLVGDVHGLLLEDIVPREGVAGQQAAHVPDVRLKHGDVADLQRETRRRGILSQSMCKHNVFDIQKIIF